MINQKNYGFYGHLNEQFPSQVIVDITERCNLACKHCPHEEFTKSAYYSARDLEIELNSKLVDEVRDHGQGKTIYIRYSSEGEPLLHPKAVEMIGYAAKASGVFVTLTSNGTLLDGKIAESLVESGVHMIDISVDAFRPETYAKIRKNGDLAATKANVIRLLKLVRSTNLPTRITVSFIEQPENALEVDDFRAFWSDQGIDHIVIRKLHSAAGTIGGIAGEMKSRQRNMCRKACIYPWERIVLTPRGYLAFCPADWAHGSSITDYRLTSIRDVWKSSFYQRLRKAHTGNSYEGFPACERCPDWEMVVWPQEGSSYVDLVKKIKDSII